MRTLLIVLFALIQLASFGVQGKNEFYDNINDGYASYDIVKDVQNEKYIISVVKGINKNHATYGIYFYSEESREYYIALNKDGKDHKFKTNKRGDVSVDAVRLDESVTIYIYDVDDNIDCSIEISYFKPETFHGSIIGNNKGCDYHVATINERGTMTIYLVAISLLGICAISIIIFKTAKGGNYLDKVENENIVDYFKLVEEYENEGLHDEDKEESKVEIKVYERTRDYEDFDNESCTNNASVKEKLNIKGYKTEYNLLDVDEKNMVMIELMKMKKLNEITPLEYEDEVIDLWKK